MEKDVSGLAVERAFQVIQRVKQNFAQRVPYGPTKAKMTPREARRFIQNMEPGLKESFKQRMGPEEWDTLMGRLYGTQ